MSFDYGAQYREGHLRRIFLRNALCAFWLNLRCPHLVALGPDVEILDDAGVASSSIPLPSERARLVKEQEIDLEYNKPI